MGDSRFPHQDRDWFLEKWREAGYNLRQMAVDTGVHEQTLGRWRGLHELAWPAWINPKGNTRDKLILAQRPPLVPILNEPITMEGDLLVTNDWHAPIIHYDTFHRALDDANKRGINQAVCVGDITNQDALTGHEILQETAGFATEGDHLNYAVSQLLDAVEILVVAYGNHDRHAHIALRVDFERSLRMILHELPQEKLDRIHVTWMDHVMVETERGPWRLCHTRNYSVQPLAYPNKLALRYGTHVAGAHRHHLAIGRAANGKDIVDLPALADFRRMAYLHRYTNHLPEPQNGYSFLINGRMQIPMLTNG